MSNNIRVLISGAGGYLGSNVCYLLSKFNYNLVCIEKNKKKMDSLKKKLNNFGNKKNFFLTDITKEKSLIKISRQLRKKNLFIDVIINNAANNPPVKKSKKAELLNVSNWQRDLDVGLLGAYIVTKTFVKNIKPNNGGSIINIGSDLSILSPNHEMYKNNKKIFKTNLLFSY